MVAEDRLAQIDAGLEALERVKVRVSFRDFLNVWTFRNRESGEETTFGEHLWPGQERLVNAMSEHPWLFALKAGKLGFTELECAWDGWRALFGPPNSRVHLFSKDGSAAEELLDYVRFGLTHLPPALAPTILAEKPGGDTMTSLRMRPPMWAAQSGADIRVIRAYNAAKRPGVDLSCQHAHIDELWAMPFGAETWSAVASTVAPGGSCHIVTRGGGQGNFVTELWEKAKAGTAELAPFFEPWTGRSDRDRAWYAEQEGKFTPNELSKFAPVEEEDALYASDVAAFVPLSVWDACHDPELPPYLPGNKEVAVMGIDAAVGRKAGVADTFGIVVVTRHPGRPRDVAIRAVRKWEPPRGGQLDLSEPEDFVFALTLGGCAAGHHRRRVGDTLREGEKVCAACEEGIELPRFNIHTVVYDPSQMVYLAQKFKRELNCAVREFSQQNPRSAADRQLYDLIISNRIAHNLDKPYSDWMRDHVGNAVMRFQTREDSKMRIDKRSEATKVDLLVAASMAVHECLRLLLTDTG